MRWVACDRDDVAVIMEESANYTLASLKHDIIKEGGGNNPLVNVTFTTASELFESLQLDDDDKYLGETPPMSTSCLSDGGVEQIERKNIKPITSNLSCFIKSFRKVGKQFCTWMLVWPSTVLILTRSFLYQKYRPMQVGKKNARWQNGQQLSRSKH
jgi:hypothetical protein